MSLQIFPKANEHSPTILESSQLHAGKSNGYPFSRPSFSTSKLAFGLLSSVTSLVAMSLFMTLSATPVYSLSNALQPIFEPSLSQGSSNSFVDRLQCPMPLESKQICNIRPDQTCPIVEEIKRFVYLQAHPNADWNGAFSRTYTALQLDLLKQEGYYGKFAHLNDPEDLPSVLETAVKEHLEDQKIDFLIVEGHGTRDEIHLSSPGSGRLPKIWRPESLLESSKAFQYLHENATIILQSCNTGTPPYPTSFAGRLSKIAKRTVIAPEISLETLISLSQIQSNLEMRKSIFDHNCIALNEYKNGDISLETKRTNSDFAKCLKRNNKIQRLYNYLFIKKMTPLMHAAAYQPSAVPILIEAGADVNAADKDGWTALMLAAKNEPSAVPSLIEAGANVNASNIDNWTVLMFAAALQPTAIPLLIEAGANVNAAQKDGTTAIMIAATHQPTTIPALIEAGADVNAADKNGSTAIMKAAYSQPTAIPALIEAGANVNAADKNGSSPLMIAVKHQPLTTKALLQAGANVNATNKEGQTPLMLAIKKKSRTILSITILLLAGADINAIDKNGDTPLLLAFKHRPDVILYMLTQGAYVSPVLSAYYKRFLSNFI